MGADLILMALSWKPSKKEKLPEEGFRGALDAIDNRIDKIKKMPDQNDLLDISNGAWVMSSDEEGNRDVTDDEGNSISLDDYKQHLYDLVDELRHNWGARDTTLIFGKQETFFVAGGMSWGDSPGETYDVMLHLSQAGVL
jgi:hypothetical protein